jgi:hypothetical protein
MAHPTQTRVFTIGRLNHFFTALVSISIYLLRTLEQG